MMREALRKLPTTLRTQVLWRIGIGLLAIFLFLVIWISSREFTFAFPCLILAVFLFVNSGRMLYNIIIGSYICISGECTAVELVGLRRRVKSITVDFDGKKVVLPIKYRIRKIAAGEHVTLYLSDRTPVYEQDGIYCIYDYYALAFGERVIQS